LRSRLKAAAESSADPKEDDCEPDVELISIPAVPKYRDPLHVIIDYIAEERPNCDAVIVHDDDLALLDALGDGASLESLQQDVVLSCLRSSKPAVHEAASRTSDGTEILTVASLSASFGRPFLRSSDVVRVRDRRATTKHPPQFRIDKIVHNSFDIYTDGYISHMFGSENTRAYFARLLHANPCTLRFNTNPEWPSMFLICNPQMAQRPFGFICEHPAWLLDFNINPIGTVVQQRIWAPQNVPQRHPPELLNMPIFCALNDGVTLGLPVVSAGARDHMTLHGAGTTAPVGEYATTFIRINWPGYSEWSSQIMTRDQTPTHHTINVEKFVKRIASAVCRFIDEAARMQPEGCEARWRIGPGAITRGDIVIIGVVHVPPGSWQPILQLNRHII